MFGKNMKYKLILNFTLLLSLCSLAHSSIFPIPEKSVQSAFGVRNGTFVIIDCLSEASYIFHSEITEEKLPPCSTFKIWNTLIGLENGIISSPENDFYKWDGEKRFIPEWNKDLTLKEAFKVSCVPAFQNLARKIGSDRMQAWIDKIGYGDRNISAGIDVFWLPEKGRKTLLITPEEQARLIYKLVSGKLPFSERSRLVLKEIMSVKKTERGVLYGKTGSGSDEFGKYNLGLFVGFIETQENKYAFACVVKGDNVMGKGARAITETILEKNNFL